MRPWGLALEAEPFKIHRQRMGRNQVYGLWFGGSNYAEPDWEYLEVFGSLADARRHAEARYFDRFRQDQFNYVFRRQQWDGTPGVDQTSHIKVWLDLDLPSDENDVFELPEPDRYVLLSAAGNARTVEHWPHGR